MSSKTIEVSIAQPIPNAPAGIQNKIIAAWIQAGDLLNGIRFKVEDPLDEFDVFHLSMDLSQVVAVLERAAEHEGGFTKYRQEMRQGSASINSATIRIELTAEAENENTVAYYHAAAVALQQLYLALNIAVPGSCQIVDAKYLGGECASFDPPVLEATPFINAYLHSVESQWLAIEKLNVDEVWNWLKMLKTSETETAIRPVNKALFGLLELGRSQSGLSNKDVLLICKLLELLTSATDVIDPLHIRSRIALILGHASREGDSIAEIYRLKQAYTLGARPFRRQAVRVHDFEEEFLRNLRDHNSPVEEGVTIVLAILQKLCKNSAAGFQFEETVSIKDIE